MSDKFDWNNFEAEKPAKDESSFDWNAHPVDEKAMVSLGNPSAPGIDMSPKVSLKAKQEADQTVKDLARGAGQGLTLGLSDELVGGAQAISDLPSNKDEFIKKYEAYRDAQRQANEQAAQRSPVAYNIGEFAGGAALPMGAGVQGVKEAALLGAGVGAGAGFGHSKESTASGIASDTGEGLVTGGLLGGALGGLASKLNSSNAKNLASEKAAAALGIGKTEAKALGRDEIRNIGKSALDSDLVQAFMNPESLEQAANQRMSEVGPQIGSAYKQAQEFDIPSFSREELLNRLTSKLSPEEAELVGLETAKIGKIAPIKVDELNQPRAYTQDEARALQQKLSELGYSKKTGLTPEAKQSYASAERDAKNLIIQKLKESGEEGTNIANQIGELDKLYRPASIASRNLGNQLAAESVGSSSIPTKVKDLLQTLGPEKSTQASFLNQASKVLPENAGSIGAGISSGVSNSSSELLKSFMNPPVQYKPKDNQKIPNNYGAMNEVSPERMQMQSDVLKDRGPAGEYYSNILDAASNGNDLDRASTLFQLNQQPSFRKLKGLIDKS